MQTRKIIEHITRWLKTYVEKSGLKGFVVGVSGGIDSAVTSTLCAGTEKDVLVLNMPICQARDQVSRASGHIAWLEKKFSNVKGIDVDLTPLFRKTEDVFPEGIQDGLTMANTRSRLRMLTLYAFASHHRMLVAGTGNKIEDFGVGFFTKYGDGGVDVSPIADLTKSQVYALAKTLEIDKDIIKAPPTDGLWEDERSDESQLGASYEELEWAMEYEAMAPEDKDSRTLDARQREVVSIFRKFNSANRHKIDPVPVCVIPEKLIQ